MPPGKLTTSVRLTEAGRRRIAERAARADVDFSHMLRRMLSYADRFMPDMWVPSPSDRVQAMEQAPRRTAAVS